MSNYTCDSPEAAGPRGVCGKPAEFFFSGEGYHRPLCEECTRKYVNGAAIKAIDVIDPTKVPGGGEFDLPPLKQLQKQESHAVEADEEEKEEEEAPPKLSRPPLREALADLATALLLKGQEEIERWRRR